MSPPDPGSEPGQRSPLDAQELARWRAEADVARVGGQRDRDAASHAQACFRAEQAAQLALQGCCGRSEPPDGAMTWSCEATRLGVVLGGQLPRAKMATIR